jgi:hypothetical protein
MIAHAAVERDHRTVFGGANVLDQNFVLDGVAHQQKKIGLEGFSHGQLR